MRTRSEASEHTVQSNRVMLRDYQPIAKGQMDEGVMKTQGGHSGLRP